MERLPIELQEIIYEKAYKLQFNDCIKDIATAHMKMLHRMRNELDEFDDLFYGAQKVYALRKLYFGDGKWWCLRSDLNSLEPFYRAVRDELERHQRINKVVRYYSLEKCK